MVEEQIEIINLDDILCDDEFNCRSVVSPSSVMGIAKSIKLNGLLQPVTLRPGITKDFKYDLIIGFRRYKAHLILRANAIQEVNICEEDIKEEPNVVSHKNKLKILKEELEKYSVIKGVVKDVTPEKAKLLNLIENLERQDLGIIEESRALLDYHTMGVSITELSGLLGRTLGWVKVRYQILELPEKIQKDIANGMITNAQINDVHALDTDEERYDAVRKIRNHKLRGQKGTFSVRKRKKVSQAKTRRTRAEVFSMMGEISDALGNGLHTRCMAWAVGEINDIQLYYSMEEYAIKNELEYRAPKPNLPPTY